MLRMPSMVITKRSRSKQAMFLPTFRDGKIYKLLFLRTVVDEIYPVFPHCYTLYQLLSSYWLLIAYEMGR
nr:hypothetical protein [Tanacetum cinerariifolium]